MTERPGPDAAGGCSSGRVGPRALDRSARLHTFRDNPIGHLVQLWFPDPLPALE